MSGRTAVPPRRRPPRPRRAVRRRALRPVRTALALGAALLALLAGACRGEEAADPIRIAELLEAAGGEPIPIVAGSRAGDGEAGPGRDGYGPFLVGGTPVVHEVDLPAEGIGRLRVRATGREGGPPLVQLAWRLAGERRFAPYRALTFPVEPDGEEHVYHLDLRREPYWTGRVAALRWQGVAGDGDETGAAAGGAEAGAAVSGGVEIAEVTALPPGDATRVTSLKGVTLPTLPGRERIEIALPEDAPRRAAFEARLGLLPRFERPGVAARFRAWVEDPRGGRTAWLDEEVLGGEPEGWRPVRREVDLPRGATLVLEAEALRDGHPLPDGSAVWGAPVLVPARRGAGEPAELVLLVVVDTLRADVLGSYGDAGGVTPRLDRLAARSVRFDDALAPSPWTLPSVATLLTGQPPQVHGAGRRIGDLAPTALGPALPTLAEAFAREGWYAAGVYNNIFINPAFGIERGFDEYAWVEMPDDVVVDRALERLTALADRRTFFLLHLFGPHHPYTAPEAECRRVARSFAPEYSGSLGCEAQRTDVPTLSGELPPEGDRRWIEGLYRAEVAFTDAQVGRLLDGLAELGLAEKAVVLVVSDHGEAFWDRLAQERAHGYEHADHGHTHYRELVRVPAVLHRPGSEPRVVGEPVEMTDWMPTLLALAGIAPPATAGTDLRPLLAGEPAARRTLLSDALLYGPSRWSARRGPWKLVAPREEGLPTELYDLAADPAERRDLAAARPDVAAALRAYGERELAARDKLRRRLGAGDDDALESAYLEWNHITKLRSLGYLK